MGGRRHSWSDLRGLRLVLLLLALSVRLLTPPGYMPGGSGGVSLAICTGHGPATLAQAHHGGAADPASRTSSNQVCAFADHTAWPATAAVLVPGSAAFAFRAPIDVDAADVAPGRGLVAPPPPSQAPPRPL